MLMPVQALSGGQRWLEWHQDFLSQQSSRKQVEPVMTRHLTVGVHAQAAYMPGRSGMSLLWVQPSAVLQVPGNSWTLLRCRMTQNTVCRRTWCLR